MIENFQKALGYVLEDEGGNTDDPDDHGGRTSRGVTQNEWDAWLQLHPQLNAQSDVFDAPDDQIDAIYQQHYWQPWCDKLPSGLDYLYFDFCVNAGPHRATVTLQRAIGVADDGIFGPVTLLAATRADPKLLISAFSEQKRKFYRALRQPKYLKGWLARVDRVEDRANTLVQLRVITGDQA